MTPFQLDSKLRRGATEALVVHCGDYRFQGAFQELLNRALSLNENYDLMVTPGGPQSLALADRLPKFSVPSWEWFRFFVENHGIRRIILIQHQDCAWYKATPSHLHSYADVRARQEEDLRRVTSALQRDFPDLRVELYYAGWGADERITIDSFPT